MMRTTPSRLIGLLLFTLTVCFSGAVPASADQSGARFRPSQLIVFGDSNTDSGMSDRESDSFYHLTGGFLTGPPNVGGRFSNGEVVVEYVADELRVPLRNFSVGGAMTGRENIVEILLGRHELANTGALAQVESYRESLGHRRADRNALYVYWAGSNDLFGATPSDLPARVDQTLANIEDALTILDRLGARHILVATRTPRPDYASADNVNGVVLNAVLTVRIGDIDERLKADIEVFDAFAFVTDMMYFPAKYGFTETIALCMPDPVCSTNAEVAAGYVQWDAAHKTTRVHELLADRMVAQAVGKRAGR